MIWVLEWVELFLWFREDAWDDLACSSASSWPCLQIFESCRSASTSCFCWAMAGIWGKLAVECALHFDSLCFSFTVTTRAVRPNPRKIIFWRVSANQKPWRTKRTRTRRIRGTTTVARNSITSRPSPHRLPTRPAKGKSPSPPRSPALSSYPLHVQQSPCGRPMTSQLTGLYASPYQRKSSIAF